MCTVTFIARQKGYCLGMNRDEKLTRVSALPPTERRVNGRAVLCPSEPTGGTWIALNDAGVCFALVNCYSVKDRVKERAVSRGEVVNIVGGLHSACLANEAVNSLPLEHLNPFRLIGVFPASHEILEWRWNQRRLTVALCPWRTQQWISSGFDEGMAQKIRDRTFRRCLAAISEPNLHWLRTLHGSHSPNAGPFSSCVHRADAGTVSFTEVAVKSRSGVMSYRPGYPCKRLTRSLHEVRLRLSIRIESGEDARR
jgi:hypothetical protein